MQKNILFSMLAILALGSITLAPQLAAADNSATGMWAEAEGMVTQWGTTPAFGFLEAHAVNADINGTIIQEAFVHATWSTSVLPNETAPAQNFSLSFFASSLVQTSNVIINASGYGLFVQGLWDVANITISYIVQPGNDEPSNYTLDIVPVATNATGQLQIPADWSSFTLDIQGINTISGIVIHQEISNAEIEIGDVEGNDGVVDIRDLVHEAKAYGSMPGFSNYGMDMDFDFNFRIDVGDLATIGSAITP